MTDELEKFPNPEAFKEIMPYLKDGIDRVAKLTGVTRPGDRYKVFRAIAFMAVANAIEDGEFHRVVEDTLHYRDSLPHGYRLETATPRTKRKEDSAGPPVRPVLPAESSSYREAVERRKALRQQ